MNREFEKLKGFLDKKVDQYDQPSFIDNDPVCIPHMFKKKQDIEIAGFFAAIFAWGNRTIIINIIDTNTTPMVEICEANKLCNILL